MKEIKITTAIEAAVLRRALEDYLEKIDGNQFLTERREIAERLSGEAFEMVEEEKRKEKS